MLPTLTNLFAFSIIEIADINPGCLVIYPMGGVYASSISVFNKWDKI